MSYLPPLSCDPAFNLALEQYAFDRLDRDRDYFMLWQNDNSVIVGRHQNTAAEINEPFVRERGIRVVRRLSGGGAVYHDLGNLNFTFIVSQGRSDQLDLHLFCRPVLRALRALGVDAELNGRNDITVDGKKFSGNAQYRRDGRVMHHGTILFDSDLSVVSQALRVPDSKLQAKGVKSVRSRVTNLRPYLPAGLTLAGFRQYLLEEIFAGQAVQERRLAQRELEEVQRLRDSRYASWEWNYGTNPACSLRRERRFEGCGTVEARIGLRAGRIESLRFYGDFFSQDDPGLLARRLTGQRLVREELLARLEGVPVDRYILRLTRENLADLLAP